MKIKVLKTFKDKNKNELMEVGKEYIINKDRYAEMIDSFKKFEEKNGLKQSKWIEEVK